MCSALLTGSFTGYETSDIYASDSLECKIFLLGMTFSIPKVRYPAIVLGLSVLESNSQMVKCRWRAMPQQFRVTYMRRGTA